MFEPVLFPSSEYESASAAVLFCKELLERNGHGFEALKLEGIDVVNSAPMARVAYGVLRSMHSVNGDTLRYVNMCKGLLESLLGIQREPLRAAS